MRRKSIQLTLAERGTHSMRAGSCGLQANTNSRSEVHSIKKNRYALPNGNKHCGGQLSSGWKSFSASSLTMTPATPGRLQPDNGSIDGSRTASEMANTESLSA